MSCTDFYDIVRVRKGCETLGSVMTRDKSDGGSAMRHPVPAFAYSLHVMAVASETVARGASLLNRN